MSKKLILAFCLTICTASTFAQEVQMADKFREDGKIYVVIAVLVTILLGILFFLFLLDKKVTKLHDSISQQ
jgi:fluoride ion exporter CrcB/FEX